MVSLIKNTILVLCFGLISMEAFSQQRFPRPEFESGYEQPSTATPEPVSQLINWADVLVLTVILALTGWLVLKKRSRKGVFILSVFSLLYFGFFKEGCICSVGSVQNVALSIFDANYAVSFTVIAFFVLPLLFALLMGRVFCATGCPLGVLQDLVLIKPITIPAPVQKTLTVLPHIYLAFALLFATTGTSFIICKYDPFVGVFRLSGPYYMIFSGVALLAIGLFVGRPYCRFLCPYGVLLGAMSKFSHRHLKITPSACIQCKLCSNSCPFDAIEAPTQPSKTDNIPNRKFAKKLLLIPLLALVLGFLSSESHEYFAMANDTYNLSHQLKSDNGKNRVDSKELEAFRASGQTLEALQNEAIAIKQKFYTGSWLVGIYIGLVLGFALVNVSVFRKVTDYQPIKSDCVSCGRCFKYCPVKPNETLK